MAEAVPMEVDEPEKKDQSEGKKQSTSEYLRGLGIGGKRKKQREDEFTSTEKKKDFTADLAAALEAADKLVAGGDWKGALKSLLVLEKKTRLAQDSAVCKEVVLKMLAICMGAGDWKELGVTVALIAKRRSALQKVIYTMVVKAMEYLEQAPDDATKVELIETLRTVTSGKIFVELESARLTRTLAAIREAEGKVVEAANILQEVSVETCGSMEAREKAEFMLEQVRLCLAKKDWVRSRIMAKKIKRTQLTEQGFHDLKLTHCKLSNVFHFHDSEMLELAQDFLDVFNTPEVQEDAGRWQAALQRVVLFVVLAQFGKDQHDMLQRMSREKKLTHLPVFQELLTMFTTSEVIQWDQVTQLEGIAGHAIFSGAEWAETESQAVASERGQAYWKKLRERVTEHNVRMVSKYYSRIQLPRMAALLSLDVASLETTLSNMVSDRVLTCKIDRPAGVVSFRVEESADAVLDGWSADVSQLLTLVERTCHLIQRENMIAGAAK